MARVVQKYKNSNTLTQEISWIKLISWINVNLQFWIFEQHMTSPNLSKNNIQHFSKIWNLGHLHGNTWKLQICAQNKFLHVQNLHFHTLMIWKEKCQLHMYSQTFLNSWNVDKLLIKSSYWDIFIFNVKKLQNEWVVAWGNVEM